MNLYLVVEGKTEKIVYRSWIKYIFPNLSYVDHISDVTNDNYLIINGGGYKSYLTAIANSVQDINDSNLFDLLVVCIDSEDMSYTEKYDEIDQLVSVNITRADYRIIVQHYCFETWFLGNQDLVSLPARNRNLTTYLREFNVRDNDPELLTSLRSGKNRAQFSKMYLNHLFQEKYNLRYIDNNPKKVQERTYFDKLIERYRNTGHIRSFNNFILLNST